MQIRPLATVVVEQEQGHLETTCDSVFDEFRCCLQPRKALHSVEVAGDPTRPLLRSCFRRRCRDGGAQAGAGPHLRIFRICDTPGVNARMSAVVYAKDSEHMAVCVERS